MNRKTFTVVATLMGFLAILLAAALTLPTANAAADTGGARLEAEAAGLTPEDPARGLTYEGLEPGPVDGPCEGLFELHSETGEVAGCTHGPDPSAEDVGVRERRSLEQLAAALTDPKPGDKPPAPPIPCIEDSNGQTDFRVQAIYAYTSDLPGGNRYAQSVPLIRRMAAEADQVFYESAKETGGRRHVRFVTDGNCQLAVDVVRLSPTGDDDFAKTITQLQGRGYTRSDRKYLVWMDANPSDGFTDYCGIGETWEDDDPDPQNNYNNGHPQAGPMFARVDPGCWGGLVEAHELMHTLGGVQGSAPHASVGVDKKTGSVGGHCTDEWDRMCYDDDGVEDGWNRFVNLFFKIERKMTYECDYSHDARFDCGHDDYYHTSPPPGSYLDKHWNTANSSFLSDRHFDRDAPEVTRPIHGLADPVGVSALPYSLTWSARDASGIREFHLWLYKENLTPPGVWGTSIVIPSGAGITGNWVHGSFNNWPLLPAHGYKFAVRAVDWVGNSSGWVYGDYFWVSAFDDTNPSIAYTGTWSQTTSSSHYGGGLKRTNAAGSEASLTFYGNYIAWVGTLDPAGGGAEVYLDGTKVATVSQNGSSSSYRRVLFSKRYQCSPGQCGSHTIRIRTVGGGYVDTDVFVAEENGS